MLSKPELFQLFESFRHKNIIVIGDVMVDAYFYGNISGKSPEASAPILKINKRFNRLGGAANVALNLKLLGVNTFLFSIIGKDDKADQLKKLLRSEKISTSGLFPSNNRKTTTKFRVIEDQSQIIRLDEEDTHEISKEEEIHLLRGISTLIEMQHIDAILIQDYNKGVLTKSLIGQLIDLAKKHRIMITVDPKHKNFFEYQHIDLFKPNLKELSLSLNRKLEAENAEELSSAMAEVKQKIQAKCILTTLSEYGNALLRDEFIQSKCHTQEIKDVSGAGDTVISIATLCLLNNLKDQEISQLSNIAGTLVCDEVGVTPINKDQFFAACLQILSPIEYAK